MKILVIDGQGGRLGKLLVEEIAQRLPQAQIFALGTNSIATATMLKGGAHQGATGENPVVRNVENATAILGPMGIVVAHAILGEVTPAMALAIGGSSALKILVPMNSCSVLVAGTQDKKLGDYVTESVDLLLTHLSQGAPDASF